MSRTWTALLACLLLSVLAACSSGAAPAATQSAPAMPAGEGEAPDPAASETAFASLCPVLAAVDDRGGTPESIAPPGVTTDLSVFFAALPESVGERRRERASQIPRGMAGHASPQVLAFYSAGVGDDVGVEIIDLVHVCRPGPTLGSVLRARAVSRAPSATARDFAGQPALVASAPTGVDLQVWVAERCVVHVWGQREADVLAVAGALDVARVASACDAPR